MIKVDFDDSCLKYHYRWTDGRTDNTISRVAFATENPSNRFSINKLPELIVLPTSLKAFEDWRLWRLCLLWRLWRYWLPKMLWRFMTKHHVSIKHILTPVLWKILIKILRLIWTKIFWQINQLRKGHTHTLCDWQGGLAPWILGGLLCQKLKFFFGTPWIP